MGINFAIKHSYETVFRSVNILILFSIFTTKSSGIVHIQRVFREFFQTLKMALYNIILQFDFRRTDFFLPGNESIFHIFRKYRLERTKNHTVTSSSSTDQRIIPVQMSLPRRLKRIGTCFVRLKSTNEFINTILKTNYTWVGFSFMGGPIPSTFTPRTNEMPATISIINLVVVQNNNSYVQFV